MPNPSPFDFPWEDSLIIAFRDMQWKQMNDARKTIAKLPAHLAAVLEKTWPGYPPPLAKLDGAAENATGDVISSSGSRFFLLEFKSDISKVKTESEKFIFQLMRNVNPENKDHDPFLELSRKGHFFVFPDTTPMLLDQSPAPDATSYGESRALKLMVHPYFDVIHPSGTSTMNAVEAKKIFFGESLGWTLPHMLAYLKILAKTHAAATESDGHPMKVAIATQNGLLWTYGDLSDVLAMAKIFQKTLELDHDEKIMAHNTKLSEIEPLIGLAPGVKLELARIKAEKASRKKNQNQAQSDFSNKK
ncbi:MULTISPECIES: hypothetical protein [unclassified Pseudomonas]|uniref:hypothetical protein n=1 Tax=unclassified Pseudomonas TaxID=196821 RepID=UPI00200CAEF7|nr:MULTISPECIES: hypothetical protein [unclassified Pseudomonas]